MNRKQIPALILALSLLLGLLSGCGGLNAAAMQLKRSEGLVSVSNEEGRNLVPEEDMGLYSGYGVLTQEESYAWIDLDKVKLAKMDENSEIAVEQEGKHLEIEVKSGSLFFHVTEPLAEDETMEIRTSTMLVGIRGTCGWVSVLDGAHMNVYLLEGTVSCSVSSPAGQNTANVSAGEMVRMTASEEESSISVERFRIYDVPEFILEELRQDKSLCETIEEETGLPLLDWDPDTALPPREDAEPDPVDWSGLGNVAYYGDPAACAMTAEQAAAFAQVLREEISKSKAVPPIQDEYTLQSEARCYAGLVDAGGGQPILLYGSAIAVESDYGWDLWSTWSGDCTGWGIWEYANGQAVKWGVVDRTALYPGYLYVGGYYAADPGISAKVYPLENGRIAAIPSTAVQEDWTWSGGGEQVTRYIDGQPVTEEAVTSWESRWNPGNSLAGYSHGSDVSVSFWGLSPAEDVLAALEGSGGSAPADPPPAENTPGSEAPEAPNRPGTSVSYNPGTYIRRTTVDTTGYPIEIYYEIPVLPETSQGYRNINAFFQSMEDAFFAEGFAADLEASLEYNPYDEDFWNSCSASVTFPNSRLVCVALSSDYHMGGVHPWYGTNYYTFCASTGERLSLSDVANASKAEIETYLLTVLEQEQNESGGIFLDTFREYEADDYGFEVSSDGRLYAVFSRDEGCAWAYGGIAPIELPMGLKPEWQ